MANVSVTNTFVNGTTADASQVNTNFTDLVTYVNNRNNGTAWDAVKGLSASNIPGIFDNSSGTQNILECRDNGSAVLTVADGGTVTLTGNLTVGGSATITGTVNVPPPVRRPAMTYIGVATVDIEANTATSNQTTIYFPDGTSRSVTEDTSSTHKYRRFIITATAEFTSGTEDSGLRSGLSETTNTWYAMYAVKSVIDATKFVMAGDTTLPTAANFSTLNSRYGANGWVYLGMIRNGDNSGVTGDILSFTQAGPVYLFANTAGGAFTCHGIRFANTASATSLTYTTTTGTATTDIPTHINVVDWTVATTNGSAVTNEITTSDGGAYFGVFSSSGSGGTVYRCSGSAISGAKVASAAVNSATSIFYSGHVDKALAGGLPTLI